jgi:hypothetical protein
MRTYFTRQEKREELKKKEWERNHIYVRHHITNACMGGKSKPSNLIRLDEQREKAWHFLFGNKSFEEVAELLLRTCQMKHR